jgi:hypothetical protein
MATTILSHKAMREAAPDLCAESINLLVRERGILEAARYGFNRGEAKRLIFTGWRIRRLAGAGR